MIQLITDISQTPFGQRLTPDALLRANENLRKVREKWQSTSPSDFINGLFKRATDYSYYADLRRIQLWKRNLEYYKGSHVGKWDADGWWQAADPYLMEGLYRTNKYNYYVRSVEALWKRANTTITFRARTDNPDGPGAARVATENFRTYQGRHWDAMSRSLEAKHAQLDGNYFRRIFFSTQSEIKAWRPKIEEVALTGEDEGFLCQNMNCAMTGPTSPRPDGSIQQAAIAQGMTMPTMGRDADGPYCPNCGSRNLDYFGLPPLTMRMVTGHEQFDPGDVMPEIVDPYEVTMHLHSQSQERSPWLIRRRLFASEILEAHYPWADVPHSTTTDLRLIYQHLAQQDPGSNYNFMRDGFLHNMAELEEGWFEPAMYCHYIVPDNIAGDIRLQPGPLIEQFPDGMYCQRIGGHIVDGPWPASKSMEWIHGRFDVVPQSIWGRGQDDALVANERLEEAGSLAFEIAMHQASNPMLINQLKVDQNKMTGSPRDVGTLLNPTIDDHPGEFVWQGSSQAGGIGALEQLMMREERNMQEMFSAFAEVTGNNQGRRDTATRTAILRDQATQMHASPLELKVDCDIDEANKANRLYQQHWTGVRMFTMPGQYEDQEIKYFTRADIQGDLVAEAKQSSNLPRGEGEKRAALLEAAQFGGIEGGLFAPVWPPEVRRYAFEVLGIDLDVDKVAPDWRKQMLEIRKLQEMLPTVLETFAQHGEDPMHPPGQPNADGSTTTDEQPNERIAMFLAEKIPVEITRPPAGSMMPNGQVSDGRTGPGKPIDQNSVHWTACNIWLLTDDGMKAHPTLRRAIMIHMQEHVAAEAIGTMWDQMMQIAANAPMMQLQQAQADRQSERNMDEKSQQQAAKGGGKRNNGSRRKPTRPKTPPSGNQQERRLPGMAAGAMS